MIQLKVLAGPNAGETFLLAEFPAVLGRAAQAHVRLEVSGVWDRHLELQCDSTAGFTVTAFPSAPATLNGEQLTCSALRSGDVLGLGAARLQFWLADVRQKQFGLRESLTWLLMGLVFIAELALLLKFLP
jgi:hypothetical protein